MKTMAWRVFLATFFAAFGALSSRAGAAPVVLPEGVSLFAGGSINFQSGATVRGGAVVAGGDVHHAGGLLGVDEVRAGGGFSAGAAAFQNSRGPLLFNGDILNLGGPGSVFGGPVTSTQGRIDFRDGSLTVNGDVTAAGDVELEFSFGTINGDVTAGGAVNITGVVNGAISAGAPVNPSPFAPPTLPAGRALAPGAADVNLATFEDIALAPGAYGVLNFASANTVSLSTGSYVFEDIVSGFSLNELSFDTTAGPIDIYVAAPEFSLDNLVQVVNGESLFAGNAPPARESLDIFIEAAGGVTVGSPWYGTLFAPGGDVVVENFSSLTGRVFAGGDLSLGALSVLTVPEPASAFLLGPLGALVCLHRRRQRE